MSVGVIVLLLAAIALVNRGSSDSGLARHPHTQEGARQAADDIVGLLGSEKMLTKQDRDEILDDVYAPGTVDELRRSLDQAYTPGMFKRLGLDEDGAAPAGYTFVCRDVPLDETVTSYRGDTASVRVWSLGAIGLAGHHSPRPVTSSWYTKTLKLTWAAGRWRLLDSPQQTNGPAPKDQ
ncbi:hypothetical protein OG422_31010 (plasmid) [Streptomyces sp. NBC_01525]|uniref:hypothetical protein n=1 Tax=Streptomyces sp. NBC_01525 TaxID=2903893 RepID=UPI002F907D24